MCEFLETRGLTVCVLVVRCSPEKTDERVPNVQEENICARWLIKLHRGRNFFHSVLVSSLEIIPPQLSRCLWLLTAELCICIVYQVTNTGEAQQQFDIAALKLICLAFLPFFLESPVDEDTQQKIASFGLSIIQSRRFHCHFF